MTVTQASQEAKHRHDAVPTKPTENEIIAAIIRDAAAHGMTVTEVRAKYIIGMFKTATEQIREERAAIEENGADKFYEPMYYLDDMDLQTAHPVLDVIMPDDTVPTVGSAPDLLGRHFLDGATELNFVHTKGHMGVREGHCSIAMAIDRTDGILT